MIQTPFRSKDLLRCSVKEMSDLDQDVKLGGSSLIQWASVLTDQRTEVMAQLQDFIQTVEHLRVGSETTE